MVTQMTICNCNKAMQVSARIIDVLYMRMKRNRRLERKAGNVNGNCLNGLLFARAIFKMNDFAQRCKVCSRGVIVLMHERVGNAQAKASI